MNCKPGDLAMVVRSSSGHECIRKAIGSPVRVVSLLDFGGQDVVGPGWLLFETIACPGCGRPLGAMLDRDLQPLRADDTPTQIIAELTA